MGISSAPSARGAGSHAACVSTVFLVQEFYGTVLDLPNSAPPRVPERERKKLKPGRARALPAAVRQADELARESLLDRFQDAPGAVKSPRRAQPQAAPPAGMGLFSTLLLLTGVATLLYIVLRQLRLMPKSVVSLFRSPGRKWR